MTDTLSPRSRRRGDVLVEAILHAAWAELDEKGWADFRIADVALRAGTSKAVLYRRWPNRAALARNALMRRAETSASVPFSPSGDLRADLIAHLRAVADYLDGPVGAAVRVVLTEDHGVHHAPEDRPGLWGHPGITVGPIVDAARQSGELGPQFVGPAVLNLGRVLLDYEFLLDGRAPTAAQIDEIVDNIWLPALRHATRAPTPTT
ncbi:TetR/AcrR family transcriptional regulator [Pedococcus sp. P5_B7]